MAETPLVVLGCGYIGSRLAKVALAAGRRVRVAARTVSRLEPLRALGAEVVHVDAAKSRQFGPALSGLFAPTVVYAIPPIAELAGGAAMIRAAEAATQAGARSFIYLSSAGLYGDKPSDEWIDDETAAAYDDPAMTAYRVEEGALESASYGGLRSVVLRLAAVYGPGRGVRARLRKGDYKLIDEGQHFISRIHVDDLVAIILAAEERAPQGSRFLVGDDRPTPQREVAEWLCQRLNIPLPPAVPMYAPGARRAVHRGRRIKNDRLKAALGIVLRYPSFVEGELQIEAEEGGTPAPVVAPAPPPPRPAYIKHVSELGDDGGGRYPESDELLSIGTELAKPLGLSRIGVHLERLPPGRRTSFPHAHSLEEEMFYVLEGEPDVWIDGELHRLRPGDVAGFPPGTGIAHTVINNGRTEVKLLVVGERREGEDRVYYPLNPERKPRRPWEDAPRQELGRHDGRPDGSRK